MYSPGLRWLGIQLGGSATTEVLAEQMFPHFLSMDRLAISACYGLWGNSVDGSVCYRIDPQKPSKKKISPHATYVPSARLAAHLEAVDAIRSLGGSVDRAKRCEPPLPFFASLRHGEEATVVCLTQQWTGEDAELVQLQQLHHLKGLFFLGGTFSERRAELVAGLTSVEILAMVDVPLSPQALQKIMAMPGLRDLYLDPGSFSAHVSGDQYLEAVTRDFWLGESVPADTGNPLELEWYQPLTGASGTRTMRLLFVRSEQLVTTKECAFVVPPTRSGATRDEGPQRWSAVQVLELASRTHFADLLAEAIGVPKRANRWYPQGEVPDEIDRLLNAPTFTAQFDAVRRLHALIGEDGESPRRLAALVWGYIHLGYLTECTCQPMHEVFKARALIYAARLQARSLESGQQTPVSRARSCRPRLP